jgi:hypothetical protein
VLLPQDDKPNKIIHKLRFKLAGSASKTKSTPLLPAHGTAETNDFEGNVFSHETEKYKYN